MSIVAGIKPAVPDAAELTLSEPWIWWRACDLQVGWVLLLGDGRAAEIVTVPELGALGKLGFDVQWQGQPPEAVSLPWARLVKSRPPLWEAAYVEAVWEWAAQHTEGAKS